MKKLYLSLGIIFIALNLNAQKHSYYNKERIGLFRVLSGDYGGLSGSTTNGIYLTNQLALGINLAIQAYRDIPTFYPISAELSYFFNNNRMTPYIYGNLGYSLTSNQFYKGDVSSELGFGWILKFWKLRISPE
ncbi:hypothetical protein SAMN05216436_13131 [bacterium A37T11]|nr:hypothetical protein SAMN05216436_13131 [bacterium A37T11]